MAEAAIQSAGAERAAVEQSRDQARTLGFFKVFVFALTSISLTYSGLLPFSTIAGLLPMGNLLNVIVVAIAFSLINGYVYAAIGTAAPRYGADYYLASRVVNGPLAFASSFVMVLFFALSAGTVISSIPAMIIPMFSSIASLLTPGQGNWEMMMTLPSTNNVVLIGTVGVMLIFGLSLLPPRWTHGFMMAAAVLSLVIWAIICLPMVSASSQSFSDAWTQYMGQGSYLDHLYKARQLGMKDSAGLVPEVLAGLSFGFWMFYGYFNATLFAKEVKKPEKNLLFGSWAAILVAGAAFAVSIILVSKIIPQPEWVSAESYLYQNPGFSGLAMPWVVFYSAILRPNFWVGGMAAIVWGFGMLMMAHTFIYSASRIILAWARDNILPESAAVIHPVLHSPIISVLLVSIIAVFGVLVAAFSGSRGTQAVDPVFAMAVTQILPVLAILLLPFRDRDWFERSPKIVRFKILKFPLISLLALLVLASLSWMILSRLSSASESWTASILVVVPSFLLAIVWYYARRFFLRRQGQDYGSAHTTEPEA